jgi:hypothetical protein
VKSEISRMGCRIGLAPLAARDPSREMSYAAGLSGGEWLDTNAYDTARVGATHDAAASRISAQLPNGDLGNATELADAINAGHRLGG